MHKLYESEYQKIYDEAINTLLVKGHIFGPEIFKLLCDMFIKIYKDVLQNKIGVNWEQFRLRYYFLSNDYHSYDDSDLTEVYDHTYYMFNDDMFNYNPCDWKIFDRLIDNVKQNINIVVKNYVKNIYDIRYKHSLCTLIENNNTYLHHIPLDINSIIYSYC